MIWNMQNTDSLKEVRALLVLPRDGRHIQSRCINGKKEIRKHPRISQTTKSNGLNQTVKVVVDSEIRDVVIVQ
jgi:glycerate kinase